MLGVICEHVGLSVARILMFRTQNTTIKIFMYMGQGKTTLRSTFVDPDAIWTDKCSDRYMNFGRCEYMFV